MGSPTQCGGSATASRRRVQNGLCRSWVGFATTVDREAVTGRRRPSPTNDRCTRSADLHRVRRRLTERLLGAVSVSSSFTTD